MGKTVREVMTPEPCTIDADKDVAYAAKMLKDEDVGVAPIVEGDQLIGVLTDRDIAVKVVAEGKDPKSTQARDADGAAPGSPPAGRRGGRQGRRHPRPGGRGA